MKDAPSSESPKECSSVPSKIGSPVLFSKSLIRTDLTATGAALRDAAGALRQSHTAPAASSSTPAVAAAVGRSQGRRSASYRSEERKDSASRSVRISATD